MKLSHVLCIFAGAFSVPAISYFLNKPSIELSGWNVVIWSVLCAAVGVRVAIEKLKERN